MPTAVEYVRICVCLHGRRRSPAVRQSTSEGAIMGLDEAALYRAAGLVSTAAAELTEGSGGGTGTDVGEEVSQLNDIAHRLLDLASGQPPTPPQPEPPTPPPPAPTRPAPARPSRR